MSRLDPKEIQAQLQAFKDNPVEEMNRQPEKAVIQNESAFGTAFSVDDIDAKRYLDAREKVRDSLLEVVDPDARYLLIKLRAVQIIK